MDNIDSVAKEVLSDVLASFESVKPALESLSAGDVSAGHLEALAKVLDELCTQCGFLELDDLESLALSSRKALDAAKQNSGDSNPFLESYQQVYQSLQQLTGAVPAEPTPTSVDESKPEPSSNEEESGQTEFKIDEMAKEFFMESYESLDDLDNDFVALEEDPDDKDTLNKIFRAVHTIKGNSGFFGFKKLENVSHKGENLLDALRGGKVSLNSDMVNALLATIDAIREILKSLETSNTEGSADYTALIETLIALQSGDPSESFGDILVKDGKATQKDILDAKAQQDKGDPRRLGEILVEKGAIEPDQVVKALKKQGDHKKAEAKSTTDSNIRVDVKLLDRLMNLTGELVLSRNQILQVSNQIGRQDLSATTQQLDLVTTELQEGIMKTRMQPVATVWTKFKRIVRDLSRDLNKKIRLEMEGQDTELDKTLLEAIKDPMTHLVRNSLDHGIEAPEKRLSLGKNEEGCLLLKAYHDGGHVIIEIIDDGGGIDPEKLKMKAFEKNLITEEQAMQMSDKEALHLIFRAGFSTADKISNISGRGVGMDVVRTNIEKVGGTIDLDSTLGKGSTVRLTIPLTLAIVPALFVESAQQRFAIPQNNLLELVRLESGDANHKIEMIHGAPVYRLRGKILPLVSFRSMVEQDAVTLEEITKSESGHSVNIVVLDGESGAFGLIVDKVVDTHEMVVKPLDKNLESLSVFSGATIMGDGKVALILDVAGICRKAQVSSENQASETHQESTEEALRDQDKLLIFSGQDDGRMAINLDLVFRLEKFDRSDVEQAGHCAVMQYRNSILPLIDLNEAIEDRRRQPRNSADSGHHATMNVVVCHYQDRLVGLQVDKIYDTVELDTDIQQAGCRDGIAGTLVVEGKVSELIDVNQIVNKQIPDFAEIS